MNKKQSSEIRWDEANLQQNEEESLAANRMRITEPKTPFHYLGDDGEPEAWPPKAAPATAAPRLPAAAKPPSGSQLEPGLDLSALASQALERREEQPEPEEEPEEKKRRFEETRKAHYKMGGPKGGLAALRAQAEAALAEAESSEEDEDAEGEAQAGEGASARQS